MRIQRRIIVCTIAAIVVGPFLWIVILPGSDLVELGLKEKQVAELRDRLHHVESVNKEREDDMQSLRSQIKSMIHQNASLELRFAKNTLGNSSNVNATSYRSFEGNSRRAQEFMVNMSFSGGSNVDLSIPNMFHHLPHLIGKPEAVLPAMKYSQGRVGVSVVVGIPTIKREQESYLLKTLESLINCLDEHEQPDILIVVLIAEKDDQEFINKTINDIRFRFSNVMSLGTLEIIIPSPSYYPNMNDLTDRFGDTLERVKWRTKQNLDYTYLMMYAQSRGTFYLQLEDDVITKPGYLSIMKKFALEQKLNDWMLLSFCRLGFIGKLFRSSDLPLIVEFFLMFHKDKPVDWLLDHLLYVKVCNPEKDNKSCFQSMDDVTRRFKPSLFQHIGTYSSLRGKVQNLKDKDFGKGVMYRAHLNPNADVRTSIRIYEQYSLDRAYAGDIFFWGILPKMDDTVEFRFLPSIRVEKYLFRSGNVENPGDRFYNTTVEIMPSVNSAFKGDRYSETEDGFYIINQFNESSSLVEGVVSDDFGPIDLIRLHVHSDSASWVILSEIYIQEKSDSSVTSETRSFV